MFDAWYDSQRIAEGDIDYAVYVSEHSRAIQAHAKDANPKIAVVIPAYNEESSLPRTLRSVDEALGAVKDAVAVIVVNNNSTDNTEEVATDFGARVVSEERKGIGWARQSGLLAVPESVRYVMTTDADSYVSNQWVRAHHNLLERRDDIVGVNGLVIWTPDGRNLQEWGKAAFYTVAANTVHVLENALGHPVGSGSNASYRKNVADSIGGYDSNLAYGEDKDLFVRLAEKGAVTYIGVPVYTSMRRQNGNGFLIHSIEVARDNAGYIFHGFRPRPSYKDFRDV